MKDYQARVIASRISDVIEDHSQNSLATLVAGEITSVIENSTDNKGNPTAEQVDYYINRAAEEVNNGIRDIDFSLGNILSSEKPEIVDVVTDSNNVTKVTATKDFRVDDVRLVPKAISALSSLKIPGEFAKYISVSMDKSPDRIIMNLVVTLPKSYVDSIDGGDFKKRATLVDKAISKILDSKLGD